MQWIDRAIRHGLAAPVAEKVLVPAGQTPEFWNQAISLIVERLRQGAQWPDHPTVPMSGGHGTLNAEARHLLCADYLYAESPERRAYAQLRMVGQTNDQGQYEDRRQAKETRLCAAVWLQLNPLVIVGVDPTTAAPLGDLWTLLMAAYYELGILGVDARTYYESAVARCRSGGKIMTVALGERGFAIDQTPWAKANLALSNPRRAQLLLARLMLHVVCVRLFIVLPARPLKDRYLFSQMLAWMEGLVAAPVAAADAARCTAQGGPPIVALRQLLPALRKLRPFGGNGGLDPGARYPSCFRAYVGGPILRLDLLLEDAEPRHRDAISQAYLLGVLIVDKLMDLMQVEKAPRPRDGGFDRFAYANLEQTMKTSRTSMGWGHAGLPHSDERLQLQRHVEELAASERCVEQMAAMLPSLPQPAPPAALHCTACRSLIHRTAAAAAIQGGGHV